MVTSTKVRAGQIATSPRTPKTELDVNDVKVRARDGLLHRCEVHLGAETTRSLGLAY